MVIESHFAVPAAPERAFRFLLDLDRVAPCIPGGALGAPAPDGVRPATVTVKLGPMRMSYEGTLELTRSDPQERTATLTAQAREARGNGSVRSTMHMRVSEASGGSEVAVTTELELTGRAAQMGRGIVEEVARKLVGEMADCLARRLTLEAAAAASTAAPSAETEAAPTAAAEPAASTAGAPSVAAGTLLARALWARFARLLGRRETER